MTIFTQPGAFHFSKLQITPALPYVDDTTDILIFRTHYCDDPYDHWRGTDPDVAGTSSANTIDEIPLCPVLVAGSFTTPS
jgi:hypothetical protein